MKIILITASIEDEQRPYEIEYNSGYPMSLAYLHSFMESKGHDVNTLFLNDYDATAAMDITINNIEMFNPDVIGFHLLTPNRVCSFQLIEYINQKYKNIKIIIGGIHATVMYEQILKKYPFVIAVLGEGEITFSEVVDNKKPLRDIEGIAFNDNGKIIKTSDRELIQNLDELPYPKHEIFFNGLRRRGNILTTRGCPFLCTFCCLRSITQRKVRYRSIHNVVDEIEYMKNKFSEMTSIWILDDSFFLDNDRVIEFCNEIVNRGIKLEFICSGRMKPINRQMVAAMEKAGFTEVMLGLESGAKEVLKSSKKSITKEDAVNAIQLFAQSPIKVSVFLIVGLPGETIETIKETAEFFQSLQKIKYIYAGDDEPILFIYPGSEVYEISKKKGIIDDDYWLTDKCIPVYTAENSIETLSNYKNILLNHISIGKMFTSAGFAAQKKMIPLALKDKFFRRKLINQLFAIIMPRSTFYKIKKSIGLDRKTRTARIASIKRAFGLTSSFP